MSLTFTTWHLIIDGESPTIEGLDSVFYKEDEIHRNINGTHYLISKEKNKR